jgi:hypothetical protein
MVAADRRGVTGSLGAAAEPGMSQAKLQACLNLLFCVVDKQKNSGPEPLKHVGTGSHPDGDTSVSGHAAVLQLTAAATEILNDAASQADVRGLLSSALVKHACQQLQTRHDVADAWADLLNLALPHLCSSATNEPTANGARPSSLCLKDALLLRYQAAKRLLLCGRLDDAMSQGWQLYTHCCSLAAGRSDSLMETLNSVRVATGLHLSVCFSERLDALQRGSLPSEVTAMFGQDVWDAAPADVSDAWAVTTAGLQRWMAQVLPWLLQHLPGTDRSVVAFTPGRESAWLDKCFQQHCSRAHI